MRTLPSRCCIAFAWCFSCGASALTSGTPDRLQRDFCCLNEHLQAADQVINLSAQGLEVQPLHDYMLNVPCISRWGALVICNRNLPQHVALPSVARILKQTPAFM